MTFFTDKAGISAAGRSGEESSLAPFRHPAFTVLWVATVVSNIGTWMQNAAAGWLMTGLDPNPFTVALVQVATALPMFIFVLPAGALADIVDRRRLLIVVQLLTTLLVAAFAFLIWLDVMTPGLLLAFSFLVAAGAALILPAWQAIVPQLVPPRQLQPAVALNSVGLNVSRAAGPALAGVIIGIWGLSAPFWLNAVSTLGVVTALIWWQPNDAAASRLPPERFGRAIGAGLRHARHNPELRATLVRAAGFFIFASAYWALLPLVARNQIAGGPELYGVLLGAIGAGAVGAAFALPALRRQCGPGRLVALGTVGTAVAMVLFGQADEPVTAIIASVLAGASWIAVLTTINVSAQLASPAWVRGRALAILGAVMFGALTAGSAAWGQLAAWVGLPDAHYVAAAGALLVLPLLRGFRLQSSAGPGLKSSPHWPQPVLSGEIQSEGRPTLVTVDYWIRPEDHRAFLEMTEDLERERRRDGAFGWGLFEDVVQPGHFVEAFRFYSWVEHLRQHERAAMADQQLHDAITRLDVGGRPKVTHLVSVR
jgi:MFS family permease